MNEGPEGQRKIVISHGTDQLTDGGLQAMFSLQTSAPDFPASNLPRRWLSHLEISRSDLGIAQALSWMFNKRGFLAVNCPRLLLEAAGYERMASSFYT